MVALSRNVSRKHAMEMLMTGEMISAERAREIGGSLTVDAAAGAGTRLLLSVPLL